MKNLNKTPTFFRALKRGKSSSSLTSSSLAEMVFGTFSSSFFGEAAKEEPACFCSCPGDVFTHSDLHTCTLCHGSPSPSSSWHLPWMWQANKMNNCGCCSQNKAKGQIEREQQEQRQQRHSKSMKSGQVRGRSGANLVRLIPLAPSRTACPC